MPSIASRRFVETFQRALAESGRVSKADLEALQEASGSLSNAEEQAAATTVISMLRHDRELDAFEVAPVKRALGVLLGVSSGRLPPEVETVLRHAVPAANVAVKSYDLTFDLSGRGPDFPARALITLDSAAGQETILEVDPQRLAISAVKAGELEVPFTVTDGRLRVTAPQASTLLVSYTVKAVDADSREAYGLVKERHTGRMWTLTFPYNTGALFPSNSDPADGSTSRVTVRLAAGHEAVATGNPGRDGAFTTAVDAPAYSVALYTASDFELGDGGQSRDGVAVQGFGYPSTSAAARRAYLSAARESLDFYSSWLGRYDYGDTLRLVEVGGSLGGMEHTAAVALMRSAVRDPETARETAAHETAHHWFGNNIRIARWGDFWMSEGFTNYATYRFLRSTEGEAKYRKLLDRSKKELEESLADNPHTLTSAPETDINEVFDSVPYELGAWMLRMLEVKLGTPAMDALLRDWFAAKRHQTASTEEFVRFANEKTGKDFTAFFRDWGQITAVPELTPEVRITGQRVRAQLTPTNLTNPIPEGLQIPLRLEGAGERGLVVMVDPGQVTEIDAGFPVRRTTWDPDRTVLAQVRGN